MFKSKQEKEREKIMLARKTIAQMQRHIDKLEQQKKVYIEAAKKAKVQGLKASYDLALSGLKMTLNQQKRAQEMLLNFEISSQMKDMSKMTTEFLQGMSSLSKEMVRLTNEKQFSKVQAEFDKAMVASEKQTLNMEMFLDQSQVSFATTVGTPNTAVDDEIEKLITEQVAQDELSPASIDKELEDLRKKLGANS